jgi:hypothetical protein
MAEMWYECKRTLQSERGDAHVSWPIPRSIITYLPTQNNGARRPRSACSLKVAVAGASGFEPSLSCGKMRPPTLVE